MTPGWVKDVLIRIESNSWLWNNQGMREGWDALSELSDVAWCDAKSYVSKSLVLSCCYIRYTPVRSFYWLVQPFYVVCEFGSHRLERSLSLWRRLEQAHVTPCCYMHGQNRNNEETCIKRRAGICALHNGRGRHSQLVGQFRCRWIRPSNLANRWSTTRSSC